MIKGGWKEQLCYQVFRWQVFALTQKERSPGWLAASEIVYRACLRDGVIGTDISLANEVEGPVFQSWRLEEEGFVGPFPGDGSAIYQKTPYQILLELESLLQDRRRGFKEVGFHSPNFALELAAKAIKSIAQEYTCKHNWSEEWREVSAGGWDEPREEWRERVCNQCGMKEVME